MTARSLTVLFLNAGRRVELIRRFRASFERLNVKGRVVTTDIQPYAPALYMGDAKALLPHSNEPGFSSALMALCAKEKVDMVVPLIDPDLLTLSKLKTEFEKKNIKLLVSDSPAIEICRDKSRTAAFLVENGFPTPPLFPLDSFDRWTFPAIVKPKDGSASMSVFRVGDEKEARALLQQVPGAIAQPFLQGDEITTDVFSTWDAKPLLASSRKRIKVRGGEVSVGVSVRDAALEALCLKIAAKLKSSGPINIQVIRTPRDIFVIEINPRFGGGCPLSIEAGVPLTDWAVLLALGHALPAQPAPAEEGVVMMRHDDSVFSSSKNLLA